MALMKLQPMSFVMMSGLGTESFLVKVSLDAKNLIISTHYLLSSFLATDEIIDQVLGDQAYFINNHRQNFVDLTKLIHQEEKLNPEGRIKSNDVLLLIRAIHYLDKIGKSSDASLPEADLQEALKEAIRIDDLIKDIHYQVSSVLSELPKA